MTLSLSSAGPEWQALVKCALPLRVLLLLGCLMAVPVAGYGIHVRSLMVGIAAAEARQAELQAQWRARSAEVALLDDQRARMAELEAGLQRTRRERFVDDGLAGLLQSLAVPGSGLAFGRVTVLDSARRDHHVELPVEVSAVGDYGALQRFAAKLADMDRLVTLEEMQLTVTEAGPLHMVLRLQAYRAVLPEAPAERVAQATVEPRDPFADSGRAVLSLTQAAMVGHLRDHRGPAALVRIGGSLRSLREGDMLGAERVAFIDEGIVELRAPGRAPRLLHLGSVVEG